MAANPERRYALEEYLELERTSEERFEFRDGEIFCMSGVSEEHAEIETNLIVSWQASHHNKILKADSDQSRL